MNDHDTSKLDKAPVSAAPLTTILVVGCGAVGGFYGGRLAQAGARVSTVHRADCESVRQNGIRIASIDGDFHFTPHRVLRHVGECQTPPDYLLVTLKSLPEVQVAELIRPAVGRHTVIVLLQNGIGIEEPVARAFPENEIISALAFVCLQRTSPGHIRHLCFGRVTIGLYPNGSSRSVERLARLCAAANIPCKVTESPVTARWAKLVWNAAFNPISVLAGGATTEAILAVPESEALVRRVMAEVVEVARAAGHPLPDSTIEDNIQATRRMKPYHTSMALDFMADRPLESDAILGAAIRSGQENGVPTPCMAGLLALLALLARNDHEVNSMPDPGDQNHGLHQ